jgi:hypothetical protein
VSPAPSAEEHEKDFEYQPFACVRFQPAAIEVLRGAASSDEQEPVDEPDSPEAEIQAIFRTRIAGLRRLPKRERAQALRAALEWLWFAEAVLREKRMIQRYARFSERQRMLKPAPR